MPAYKTFLAMAFALASTMSAIASADAAHPKKVSVTGAVFNRDTTYPALGDAYRDPSGLVWGDLVILNNRVQLVNAADAEAYCSSIGARLPTSDEFQRLAQYLGSDTSSGYNPSTQDGQDEILLALPHYWYWSSTPYWFGNGFNFIFWGDSGSIEDGNVVSTGGAVHCVAP